MSNYIQILINETSNQVQNFYNFVKENNIHSGKNIDENADKTIAHYDNEITSNIKILRKNKVSNGYFLYIVDKYKSIIYSALMPYKYYYPISDNVIKYAPTKDILNDLQKCLHQINHNYENNLHYEGINVDAKHAENELKILEKRGVSNINYSQLNSQLQQLRISVTSEIGHFFNKVLNNTPTDKDIIKDLDKCTTNIAKMCKLSKDNDDIVKYLLYNSEKAKHDLKLLENDDDTIFDDSYFKQTLDFVNKIFRMAKKDSFDSSKPLQSQLATIFHNLNYHVKSADEIKTDLKKRGINIRNSDIMNMIYYNCGVIKRDVCILSKCNMSSRKLKYYYASADATQKEIEIYK